MTRTGSLASEPAGPVVWTPTHEAALARLTEYLPRAGVTYAQQRNFDLGPDERGNVSALSPWVRHRLILEEDIASKTLARHSYEASEKFIQEVFWRGYFKGWLEHRPEVWRRYQQNLTKYVEQLEQDASLARRYEEAVAGDTGILCFDCWAAELISTGYLHNHARMWFASVWIFTLKLPWELGADFFYRHLLDGDPASNTCSWRWVGGLHTKNKTYLALPSNIERFTKGRFTAQEKLATQAQVLSEPDLPPLLKLTFQTPSLPGPRAGLLVTEEDCSPESLELPCRPQALFAIASATARSILPMSQSVAGFAPSAVSAAAKRCETHFDLACTQDVDEDLAAALLDWARTARLDCILTARLPVGPVRERVSNACRRSELPLIEVTRTYDEVIWPQAQRGFFALKKKIPSILAKLDLV